MCVCAYIDTDRHLDRSIISPRSKGSIFGNSVFPATLQNKIPANKEN